MSPATRDRGTRLRTMMLIRLGFLIVLLIAVFAFHVSGTTLVVFRIVRIVLVALVVVSLGWFRTRGRRDRDDQRG